MRQHGAGTQQALAAALRIIARNLVGLLNEIEKRRPRRPHALVRGPSPARRRATSDGAKGLAEAEAALTAVEDEVPARLTPDSASCFTSC